MSQTTVLDNRKPLAGPVTVRQARLSVRADMERWPRAVRDTYADQLYDIYSDGEDTYVLFPWNANTRDMKHAGWRADSYVLGNDGKLWRIMKQVHSLSELEERRYRGAWVVMDPNDLVYHQGDTAQAGDLVTKDGITQVVTSPKDMMTVAEHERILAEFKAKVAEIARDYAEEHDWCSVVEDALEKMGIEPLKKVYEVEMDLRVRVYVELPGPIDDGNDAYEAASALLPDAIQLRGPDAKGTTLTQVISLEGYDWAED